MRKNVPPSPSKNVDNSFNTNLSAVPQRGTRHYHTATDKELQGTKLDYGDMNLPDAKRSGYTDRRGHAVEMAKKDRPGHPTGAYTDIGAGRSSAVRSKSDKTRSRPGDKRKH